MRRDEWLCNVREVPPEVARTVLDAAEKQAAYEEARVRYRQLHPHVSRETIEHGERGA